jgi:hypothetical protein
VKIIIIFETQKELAIPMRSSNESLEETFLIVKRLLLEYGYAFEGRLLIRKWLEEHS